MTKSKSDPITHQMPPRIAGKEGLGFIVDDPHRPPLLTHAERRRARKAFAIAAKKRAAAARGTVKIVHISPRHGKTWDAAASAGITLHPRPERVCSARAGRRASQLYFAALLAAQEIRKIAALASGGR